MSLASARIAMTERRSAARLVVPVGAIAMLTATITTRTITTTGTGTRCRVRLGVSD